jgi:hypothetical protein
VFLLYLMNKKSYEEIGEPYEEIDVILEATPLKV